MITFTNKELSELLKRVSYAGRAGPLERSHIGDRVQITQDENGLRMVCTDGHRVAEIYLEDTRYAADSNSFESSFSLGTLDVIRKNYSDGAIIKIDQNRIITDHLSIESKFDKYPNIKEVFPRSASLRVVVGRKDLQKAAKRVLEEYKKMGSTYDIKSIGFKLLKWNQPTAKLGVFSCLNEDDVIPLDHAKIAGDISVLDRIAFNVKYFEEALRQSLKDLAISIEFFGNLTPTIFRGEETYQGAKLLTSCVLMPLRL